MSLKHSIVSTSGRRVRLTAERWEHIQHRHPELRGLREKVLETVGDPKFDVGGRYGELLAVRSYTEEGKRLFLVVVYREFSKDGFIITAYLTSNVDELERRKRVWPSLC